MAASAPTRTGSFGLFVTAGEDKAVMYGNFTIVCASSPCETDNPILEHNCSYKAL